MTALTFINIFDVESLFSLIDNCKGPVYLKAERDEKKDIRGNAEVKGLLLEACNKNGIEKMSVMIDDKRDMPGVIDYLMSCKHPSCNRT